MIKKPKVSDNSIRFINTMENEQELESFFSPIVSMLSSICKTFHTDLSYYFYDSGTGKVIQCDSIIYNILNEWIKSGEYDRAFLIDGVTRDDVIAHLNELREMVHNEHLLSTDTATEFYVQPGIMDYINTNVNMLTLELTERCNLRCKYCIYQDFNVGHRNYGTYDMTFETAKSAIDFLIEHSSGVELSKKLILTFYGGEPLLQFELIKKCVDYAESRQTRHEWLFAITTNCTLLTEDKINFFADKNFSLTASIDGYKESHDANRVFPNGDGSFDVAISNLKKLALAYKERGIEGPRISINAVITPPYDFERIDKLQAFFDSLQWLPDTARITWAYAQSGPPEIEDLKAGIDAEIFRTEHSEPIDLDPISEWHYEHMLSSDNKLFTNESDMRSLMVVHDRIITDYPTKVIPLNACCVPGSRRVYVTAHGKLKICERIGESPDIGNVFDGIDFEALKHFYLDEYIEKSLPICKNCWSVRMCPLCYIYSYRNNGIDMDKKRLSCVRAKFLNERALVRYHQLLETNPAALEELLKVG